MPRFSDGGCVPKKVVRTRLTHSAAVRRWSRHHATGTGFWPMELGGDRGR